MLEPDPSAQPEPQSPDGAEPNRYAPKTTLSVWLTLTLLLGVVNLIICAALLGGTRSGEAQAIVFLALGAIALLQIIFAIAAFGAALQRRKETGKPLYWLAAFASFVLAGMAVLEGLLATLFVLLSGAAWGRPLRIRGQLCHPELNSGTDWGRGEAPDVNELDDATRQALEALWLHDAQKEHASVPAFTRVSWILAAVGAPPQLLEGAHRAALEEADHACRCFALASGYGGRSHSVQPMPDLLLAGFELKGPALEVLAEESLKDGCLLEDFNADVAAACAAVCRDPATRGVLERIAREERSHAEFSWAVLHWALSRGGDAVAQATNKALDALARSPRPTSTSRVTAPLVKRANAALLLAHGRIDDAQWAAIWPQRVAATLRRARALQALGGNSFDRAERGLDSRGR